MPREITIDVAGLWSGTVTIEDGAHMRDLCNAVDSLTGIPSYERTFLELTEHYGDLVPEIDGETLTLILEPSFLDGRHSLHYAAESGYIDAVSNWVASGADINVRDEYGETPMMAVFNSTHGRMEHAESDVLEMVETLISLGADLAAQDNTGGTVLHTIAEMVGAGSTAPVTDREIDLIIASIGLLVRRGANLAQLNNAGATALDLVAQRDRHINGPLLDAMERALNVDRAVARLGL